MGTGFMCRTARQMERAGKSVDEIVSYLESIRNQVHVILTLDTLEYARRSRTCGHAFSGDGFPAKCQADCPPGRWTGRTWWIKSAPARLP